MRLWLSILAVSAANSLLKATGPLALGDRRLPSTARRVVALMAPVLLAGLIVVELAGPGWHELDGAQVLGVGVAGLAWAARAPMLVAVLVGAAAAAAVRLL
ncbi:branched-subunit amino acid transport protein [Nocardioides thalensis]|uniref:Branched-subunit amino acid transport protein n=1 Tax=Nocardioides thalensis TaxID=1914755 RepID=A0A853C858_9ACTN|nr:AzlD domain-containing protein [Nocardioides thalensis]NYJ03341.1 branched-subunit amino acid transport protein [Nocardioides thalensis]